VQFEEETIWIKSKSKRIICAGIYLELSRNIFNAALVKLGVICNKYYFYWRK